MIDVPAFVRKAEPMLAQLSREDELGRLAGTHTFQEKIDGIRAVLGVDEFGNVVLRSRTGRSLLENFPDIELAASTLQGPVVLDGELVLQEVDAAGREHVAPFEMVNWRARLGPKAVPRAAQLHPAKFVAFDVLADHEGDQRMTPLSQRIIRLQWLDLPFGPFERVRTIADGVQLFNEVRATGGEGVMAKRLDSYYRGGRSRAWLKVKATATTSCIAYGYDDSSSRALGAVHLALLERGTIKQVGRVGSGFTDRSAADLRTKLDKLATGVGTFPVVEVAHLGLTSSGKLRQPVFKGLRTDVDPLTCTYSQLKEH